MAKGQGKQKSGVRLADRNAALQGRPLRTPPVRTEEKDGKLYVTVLFVRPRWQRVLGADESSERSFGLDTYGRTVYESCDGKRSVKKIIARFAAKVHVSIPEAEMAVTKFMKTLLVKGLVVMEMDEKERV